MRRLAPALLILALGCGAESEHDDGSSLGGRGSEGAGAAGHGGVASSGRGGAAVGAAAAGGTAAVAGSPGQGGRGPWAVSDLPYSVAPGEPIDAPVGSWSYVPIEGARCANGTPTGIAVSPADRPEGILVSMQGGGACWDPITCLEIQSAVNLFVEVGEDAVMAQARQLSSGLFDHADPANPFARYSYVFIPYCTGDLHAGTHARDYAGPSGTSTIHHRGGDNVERVLERLVASYPDVSRLLVFGVSAGGFGATLNWWRFQGAFPHARVDVLDDAGLLVDPKDDRFSTMVEAWQMVLPPGCADCASRLSALLPFYGPRLDAPRRYGLVGFLGDATIGGYFGLSAAEIETRLIALRGAAADNQKTLFLSGTQHSVVGEGAATVSSDGASLVPWLLAMIGDAPGWDHAGP